jgi:hypothetical protein
MTSTASRVQAFRRRRKEGRILLHFEISNELADVLVDTGHLGEWDTQDPRAIADAIIALLSSLGNDVTD